MKVALITYEFYPDFGGVGQNCNSFCKSFQNDEISLHVFNQFYKSKNIFNVLDKLREKEYRLRDLLIFLKKKRLIYYLLLSIWLILRDKKTPFSYKLRMIAYLLFKPDILIRTMKNVNAIYPYLKKLKVDLIFGGSSASNLLPLIFILSRIFKTKVISYAHGNEFLVRSSWSLKTYYLKMMDKVILSNTKIKALIKKVNHLPDAQLEIIPYGLVLKDYEVNDSKSSIRKEFNIPNDQYVLISVGRHVPRKKFDLVIKALNEIKQRISSMKIRYLLIGEGPETKNLKDLVNTLNLENEVKFLGAFGGTKRNKYLKLSDLFLMPSIVLKESIEGFGIVYLEANYYHLPVIGTFTGGIVDAVIDGKTGLLINPNDLDDLIEKIIYLWKEKETRTKMGDIGHNRVIEEFNWNKIRDKYINLFRTLVG